MIRTCTDVPVGILADTSAIAIAVARIIRNDIASFCPKYSAITRSHFRRFWTFSTLILDGDFQHRHVSEGHVQERHTKPLLALRWYEEFKPRSIWSLSNAFTSAVKALEPIPQFEATAKLGEFLEARFSQSF